MQFRKNPNYSNRCYVCGSKRTIVHHKTYKNLGREEDDDLLCLCNKHHYEVHSLVYLAKISNTPGYELESAHQFVKLVYEGHAKIPSFYIPPSTKEN